MTLDELLRASGAPVAGDLGTEENPVLLPFAALGAPGAESGREASAGLKLPKGNVVAGLGLVALAAFLVTR